MPELSERESPHVNWSQPPVFDKYPEDYTYIEDVGEKEPKATMFFAMPIQKDELVQHLEDMLLIMPSTYVHGD